MSDGLAARMVSVMVGHRCVGFTMRHAKGYDAYDADNALLGTYEFARSAVNAVLGATPYST